MNLTGDLRTPHFPHPCYPDHFGPFELHTIFPIAREPKALDVHYYQICISFPPETHFLGFDDFAPGWPADRELSPRAQARRDGIRDRAEYRALVRVKKVKDLLPEGIELLRDAGADVSDDACKAGLWVAVYGRYQNFPEYTPDPKATKLFHVQVIHRFEEHTADRRLHLCSIDQRTFARCMLYIERIKLRTFMINTSREDGLRTPVEQRDVEWFIKRLIDQHRYNTAHLPEKRDGYRGARKHTSEVRHTFVCHAEWMLKYSTLHKGSERVISSRQLTRWAGMAPAMRELAIQDGRPGWGVWDYVWDKEDPSEWYAKEKNRLRHHLNRVRREAELGNDADHDEDTPSGSGSRSNGGSRRSTKGKSKSISSDKGRVLDKGKGRVLDKGKGRAKSDDEYIHTWIKQASSDDEASLDDEPTDRSSKRRRRGSSPSLGGSQNWFRRGSSPSLGGHGREEGGVPNSSQSLGGWYPPHTSSWRPSTSSAGAGPSNSRNSANSRASAGSSQPGPSGSSGAQSVLSRWSGPGNGKSASTHSGTRLSARDGSTGGSNQSRPPPSEEPSARFTDDRQKSTTRASSVRFASPGPEPGPGYLETRLSQLSTTPRPAEIIVISSDDEDMAEPDGPMNHTSGSIPPHSIIEIHDTTSEDDHPMRDLEEIDELLEDDAGEDDQTSEGSDAPPRAPSSQRHRTVVSETPSQSRTPRTGRLNSHPLNTMSEEEISDSQESRNSSDSESKYGRKDRRAAPTLEAVQRLKSRELNDSIRKFSPAAYHFPDPPCNWSPWRCNHPPLTLPFSPASLGMAHRYKCEFSVDLIRPSHEVIRLLSTSPLPSDAEFLKHLTTKPCVFTGPREELPMTIFARIVQLHREEHFKAWGVRMVTKEAGNGLQRRVYFEQL